MAKAEEASDDEVVADGDELADALDAANDNV